MTFQEILNRYRRELVHVMDAREADNVFFLVNEHLVGWSRTQFIVNSQDVVADVVVDAFDQYLERLKTQEPVQYILQEAWFYGRPFFVNRHALIPRSETEQIIEIVKNIATAKSIILDVGTGSGCIAVTLALECRCPVFAFDTSHEALEVATCNANQHAAQVDFFLSDVCDQVQLPIDKFDIIVSNPPYVLESERQFMRENVLGFEPSLALFVPDHDPLKFYKVISHMAQMHLNENGWLVFEINEQCGCAIADLLAEGFCNIEIIKDIHDKDRFVVSQKVSL